jgi:xanthine dehydrogenase accessory factor
MKNLILIRGGGDLASGVALRLHRAGIRVVITELAQPLAVRRTVSFAEAVYRGKITVEGITARRAEDPAHALRILEASEIPVLIDPLGDILHEPSFTFPVFVDARLTKHPHDADLHAAPLVIGLGPGFVPGQNCHAAVETQRGHTLGRVLWDTPPTPDTRQPEGNPARVLRAPAEGILQTHFAIGDHVKAGQRIATITPFEQVLSPLHGPAATPWNVENQVVAPFAGVLRGLLHDGFHVKHGMKIGDVDPRDDPSYCYQVSDKALAIGGGVLEALLTRPEVRAQLWEI